MRAKQPALVCCVAAPEDAVWLIRWEKHLLPLQRAGYLHMWSERLLLAGEHRAQQMNQQIDQADLIVFLLSPDFFASEECLTLMERALMRRQSEQVALAPLLLRPSTWQDSPLGSLSCLPQQARPITVWDNADEALQTCVESVRQILGLPTNEAVKKRQLSFPATRRLQVIHALQQEYHRRRNHSLQGRAAIELGLYERTDVIASSARLVFHDAEAERTLPTGTTIIQVYDDAQRGLLILGAPGAGKTTLLLDLVLELLGRAENDEEHPLPIILSLSSWGTTRLTLADWLREQLYLVYGIAKKVGASWIEQDQILFLLDGLDEMDLPMRSACVAAINHYRSEHFAPLVVSSRSREYEQQQARLILPAAIEIQPLEPTRILAYLKQTDQALVAVGTVLQNHTMLQSLITTPLLLMIVLLTYRGQESNKLVQVGSSEEQQRLIFQHYIQRMLERHLHRRKIATSHLLRSLCWLAQHMQKQHQTEFYLEQLQLTWLETKRGRTMYRLLYGSFVGLLTGLLIEIIFGLVLLAFSPLLLFPGLFIGLLAVLLVGLVVGLGFGPFRGLFVGSVCAIFVVLISAPSLSMLLFSPFFGLLAGFLTNQSKNTSAEKFTWSWKGCARGAFFGLLGGLVMGGGLGVFGASGEVLPSLLNGLAVGLIYGLLLALVFGLLGGLSGTSQNPHLRRRPNQGIHTSGWNAIRFGLVFLLAFGLLAGLPIELLGGGLLGGLLVGLMVGLLGGWFGGLFGGGAQYFQHYVLRFSLWQSAAFPWRAIPLLEEATYCVLLQRVGGGYRFIHPLLQEHFASIDVAAVLKQETTPSKSLATKHSN